MAALTATPQWLFAVERVSVTVGGQGRGPSMMGVVTASIRKASTLSSPLLI